MRRRRYSEVMNKVASTMTGMSPKVPLASRLVGVPKPCRAPPETWGAMSPEPLMVNVPADCWNQFRPVGRVE